MKSELECRGKRAEALGELRRLCNKDILGLEMSPEEYDVLEQLVGETETLSWVLGDTV